MNFLFGGSPVNHNNRFAADENVRPVMSIYNENIRPVLDAIDKARLLDVMEEGLQLPTIVVIGDQSSGKSSVLESLAGISLPSEAGICTRVPLIMRLQHHPNLKPELWLEFKDNRWDTDEANVSKAITDATNIIAGTDNGISNNPITLVVKKDGLPDLTMVDLPGIVHVRTQGQPLDISDQIMGIINDYITQEDCVILNVLSATVDFATCKSIEMSQRVDKNGDRTLAVVTKADMAPEGLLEKVTHNAVKIGLGYVCVRNRVGNETYEQSRLAEQKLFRSHPSLSMMNKSMVGVPALAQKLVHLQSNLISKCLPKIVDQINAKLSANAARLQAMPEKLLGSGQALGEFSRIMNDVKETLRRILIRREYGEYPNEKDMHCAARLKEMLEEFSVELHAVEESSSAAPFLMEEVYLLEENKSLRLPNLDNNDGFLRILQCKVNSISQNPVDLMNKVWKYIEEVVVKVIKCHWHKYPQLQSSAEMATISLMTKIKDKSLKRVGKIVEMEKLGGYTYNPEYMDKLGKLMKSQGDLMKKIDNDAAERSVISLDGYGEIEIGHLRKYKHFVEQAFKMRMTMLAYWNIVLTRLIDSITLHLLYAIKNLIDKELDTHVVPHLEGGLNNMLQEPHEVASLRAQLNKSTQDLIQSKLNFSNIMHNLAAVKPTQ